MQHIVVGIDDPLGARELVEWTARFAIEFGADVTVVHAVHRSEAWLVAGVQLDATKYVRVVRSRVNREVVVPLRERGLHVDLRVDLGDPAHRLADSARRTHADLIVIGATPHRPWRELVAGDVEHRLDRLVEVPVVVVPLRRPVPAGR